MENSMNLLKIALNNTYIVTIIINSWVKVFKYYKHLNFIFIKFLLFREINLFLL